ncbi:MAG: N-acetylmuramoyl-L-alanine amidase [Pseudonocardiales bacterium]|jgi:N-acetylmuramoyl-L-alanine amidase|nr:N-acetylmuramoyl-L-alanine amidase [Pseudonocardiales bacterium]
MQLLRRGDTGQTVAQLRALLASQGLLPGPSKSGVETVADLDIFDITVEHAVRTFQQRRGLISDGIVGRATYQALCDARLGFGCRLLSYLTACPMRGDDVGTLQERLLELGYDADRADGIFGSQTEAALRSFQRDYGLQVDGVCGPATLRALRQLQPKVRGGRPVLLREQERARRAGPALRGKRIIIDPCHGGSEQGIVVDGAIEADLMWDLAARLAGRMAATGMETLLSHSRNTSPTEAERAGFANSAGGDLVLSLHTDGHPTTLAHGLATFHFGTSNGTSSTLGEALAEFIQRELTARTGMLDCGTHPKTWELLRMTRMPAVRVELGYLTNPQDRRKLLDPAFRDVVAEGIVVAVKRLYLLGENDQPTGTFTFADLLRGELNGCAS